MKSTPMDRTVRREQLAVVLLGPPGAGKGTQADLLSLEFGLFHIETSRLIRRKFSEASENDPEIQEAKRLYDLGHLVTTELVARWLIEEVERLHSEGWGIVFDGSPRTRYEAEELLPVLLRLYGDETLSIILIDVGEEAAVERISRRRVCQKCYKPVPHTLKMQRRKRCPRGDCKGEIFKRDLDEPHIVRERMEVFRKDTLPVVEFFDAEGILRRLNGEQAIENLFSEILAIVSS